MENFDYFDALKESLEQAVNYTKGDKSRCLAFLREQLSRGRPEKMHRLVLHNGCSICLNVITRWWSAWWLAEIELLSTEYDIALTAISCTLKVTR